MPRNDHPSNWPNSRANLKLDYSDRLILAYAQCQLTQERRNGFFTNDDVLDAAEAWTTTDLVAHYEAAIKACEDIDADFDGVANPLDYGFLVDDLSASIWPEEYER